MQFRRAVAAFGGAAAVVLSCLTVAPQPALAHPVRADPIVIPELLDEESLSCLELVPHVIALQNKRVKLQVRILLDGGTRKRVAKRAVKDMRKAYGPLKIRVVPSYRRVKFKGRDAAKLNEQAKKLYGGKRPKGVDVVYTMTTKDIRAEGSPLGNNVAGLADCIGGVRFAHRAFAVGEVFPKVLTGGTIPLPVRNGTGKTMAHEIGHLMGAHHHYLSPEGLLSGDGITSLMGPTLSIIALRFGTVEALMVRGHAQKYAARND